MNSTERAPAPKGHPMSQTTHKGRCQALEGITIDGRRPQCEPPLALMTHHHQGTTRLCQQHLDMWLDNADSDTGLEPAAWRWL